MGNMPMGSADPKTDMKPGPTAGTMRAAVADVMMAVAPSNARRSSTSLAW
jgi:hypothetical protein